MAMTVIALELRTIPVPSYRLLPILRRSALAVVIAPLRPAVAIRERFGVAIVAAWTDVGAAYPWIEGAIGPGNLSIIAHGVPTQKTQRSTMIQGGG